MPRSRDGQMATTASAISAPAAATAIAPPLHDCVLHLMGSQGRAAPRRRVHAPWLAGQIGGVEVA